LFVEPETERHISANSSLWFWYLPTYSEKLFSKYISGGRSHILTMAFRTRPIVRPDVTKRMVTNGYRKGVYERVTKGTWGRPFCWEAYPSQHLSEQR
jgi:hypothetical protein